MAALNGLFSLSLPKRQSWMLLGSLIRERSTLAQHRGMHSWSCSSSRTALHKVLCPCGKHAMGCGAFAPEHSTFNTHPDFTAPQDDASFCRVMLKASEWEQGPAPVILVIHKVANYSDDLIQASGPFPCSWHRLQHLWLCWCADNEIPHAASQPRPPAAAAD